MPEVTYEGKINLGLSRTEMEQLLAERPDLAARIASALKVKGGAKMTSDEWCSPKSVADPLAQFWGYADTDPCSNDRSIILARERYTWGGLLRPWGEQSYANWPYSKNEPWSGKAIYEMKIGNVAELVVLCMYAASTQWWQDLMLKPRRNPRVIATKRLKFIGPDGKAVDSSRFEPALIYYGKRSAAFDREFKSIAMWSTWGR